jgi:hypothetical protein
VINIGGEQESNDLPKRNYESVSKSSEDLAALLIDSAPDLCYTTKQTRTTLALAPWSVAVVVRWIGCLATNGMAYPT